MRKALLAMSLAMALLSLLAAGIDASQNAGAQAPPPAPAPAPPPPPDTAAVDPGPVSPRMIAAYRAGVAARRAGDFALYRARLEEALALTPGQPMVLLHLARACALAGDTLQAGQCLGRVVAAGLRIDLPGDADLAALRGTPQWPAYAADMDRHLRPQGTAEIACRITEADFMPEGIAADPVSGDLFVGSMYKRKIVRVARDGTVSDFVPQARDGLLAVLGLKVDADRRLLWACADGDPYMLGGTPADTMRTGLFGFDLESGRLVTKAMVPDTTRSHMLNDCCVSAGGDVYATDVDQGCIYRLRAGSDRLETLVGPDVLAGSNGLVLSGDERRLYVAEYPVGIAVIELATGAIVSLEHPEEIATCYVDGMLWHEGSLMVVQNSRGLDRVARLFLDQSGLRVIGMTELAARLPDFDEPTTATIADGMCVFLANTQIGRYQPDGRLRPAEPRRDFLVMSTPLQ